LIASQLAEKDRKMDQIASAEQIKEALERQMESHREQHQRQLAELRREIAEKQTQIVELTEYVQVVDLFAGLPLCSYNCGV
jgi:kinesin family protein 5